MAQFGFNWIFVWVDIKYHCEILLSGTPFILYGPVIKTNPEFSCLIKITFLPLNLPVNTMQIVPGTKFLLNLAVLDLVFFFLLKCGF